MIRSCGALMGASLAVFAAIPAPARADDLTTTSATTDQKNDILVTAQRQQQTIENAPNSRARIDADRIRTTVNAVNVEDTLRYLPSLIVRKRHIGDTQAPLATRTSGLGASARSLIYADGAILSALIGNNNTIASPRWGLVSPQEVARIDILYGPFSAAYPGNSIGAVVNITTRLPDKLELTANAATSVQEFSQYATDRILPNYQFGATAGDRFGPLALFASYDWVRSSSQPLLYVTAAVPAATSAIGTPVTGSFADVNRTNRPIRVLGASELLNQTQQRIKLKAALDLTSSVRLTYVGALFLNDARASAETYLATASGTPVYAGTLNIDDRAYTVAANAFSGGVYRLAQRDWSHSLSLSGTGTRFDWQVIGTLFDFDQDKQRIPATALPGALTGGAGTITRLDGTGWMTLDAKGVLRLGANAISAGAHYDRYRLASNRYATTDWLTGSEGQLNLRSLGKTRTVGIWAQDAITLAAPLTLTIGGRYEWWRAYDGVNFSLTPAISVVQPTRDADRFSPKASLAWGFAPRWTARLSYGRAWRFPTVSELYQVVTTPVAAIPNPNLRPERADSEELALERADAKGTLRLSLFNEIVTDALISQTGPLNGTTTLASFVQNIDRTRARGVELAVDRRDLVKGFDLAGSVTYADAITRADAAFPAAIGKLLPSVPRWKATVVATWRPAEGVALTAAGRYASRSYGTIDNSDVIGNTYQGFYRYLVVDLRAAFRVGERYTLGLGVDNVNNDKYFLFHPFTQRTFHIDLGIAL